MVSSICMHAYSFIYFLNFPEQTCIRDLRERVASGGDPTKLHDAAVDHDGPTDEQGIWAILSFWLFNVVDFVAWGMAKCDSIFKRECFRICGIQR